MPTHNFIFNKIFFKLKVKVKMFMNKQKMSEFIIGRPKQKEIPKGGQKMIAEGDMEIQESIKTKIRIKQVDKYK